MVVTHTEGVITMEHEKVAGPLMYIDQPSFEKIPATMQKEFQTGKTDVAPHTPKKEEHKKMQINQDVPFRDRTIPEKIHYLLHTPREMPTLRCEVITDEEKHRGIAKLEEDDILVLRVYGRQDVIIEKDSIKDIRLLGF
jgi:hypothetical protein